MNVPNCTDFERDPYTIRYTDESGTKKLKCTISLSYYPSIQAQVKDYQFDPLTFKPALLKLHFDVVGPYLLKDILESEDRPIKVTIEKNQDPNDKLVKYVVHVFCKELKEAAKDEFKKLEDRAFLSPTFIDDKAGWCAKVPFHLERQQVIFTQMKKALKHHKFPIAIKVGTMILNKLGFPFARLNLQHVDWSDISLPGINLFHTDLQGANLSNCGLVCGNLREADIRHCNLAGVDFGLLSLPLKDPSSSMAISGDGKLLALGGTGLQLMNLDEEDTSTITIKACSSKSPLTKLKGLSWVDSVEFSKDNTKIVILHKGSLEIWDISNPPHLLLSSATIEPNWMRNGRVSFFHRYFLYHDAQRVILWEMNKRTLNTFCLVEKWSASFPTGKICVSSFATGEDKNFKGYFFASNHDKIYFYELFEKKSIVKNKIFYVDVNHEEITSIQCSKNGKFLFVSTRSKIIRIDIHLSVHENGFTNDQKKVSPQVLIQTFDSSRNISDYFFVVNNDTQLVYMDHGLNMICKLDVASKRETRLPIAAKGITMFKVLPSGNKVVFYDEKGKLSIEKLSAIKTTNSIFEGVLHHASLEGTLLKLITSKHEISLDGKTGQCYAVHELATNGFYQKLQLFDIDYYLTSLSMEERHKIKESGIQYTRNGKHISILTTSNELVILNERFTPIHTSKIASQVNSFTLANRDNRVWYAYKNHSSTVHVCSCDREQYTLRNHPHLMNVTKLYLSFKMPLIYIVDESSGKVHVWNYLMNTHVRSFQSGQVGRIMVEECKESNLLVMCGGDNVIRFWRSVEGMECHRIELNSPCQKLILDDQARVLIVVQNEGSMISVYELTDGPDVFSSHLLFCLSKHLNAEGLKIAPESEEDNFYELSKPNRTLLKELGAIEGSVGSSGLIF